MKSHVIVKHKVFTLSKHVTALLMYDKHNNLMK